MKRCLSFFLIFCLTSGCSFVRSSTLLPRFSFNGRFHNSVIVNRIPHYGDGSPYGCVGMPEIYLSLRSASKEHFEGETKDAASLKPVPFANVQIQFQQTKNPVEIASDAYGRFSFIRSAPVEWIRIYFIGYRLFGLDFTHSRIL